MQYVGLLRGINVNGHRMIRMEDLRALCVAMGYLDVRTYIQSGNVIFRSTEIARAELESAIAAGIARRFELDVAVMVRTGQELAEIAAANPFLTQGAEPRSLYVTLLAQSPHPDRLRALPAQGFPPDGFVAAERCIYVHCPEGYHRTKLTNAFFEAHLGVPATTRNWNTLGKLAAMAAE